MPRLVRRDALGPIKIDPKTLDPEKPIWICACGLSQTFPFCDKSHKVCRETEQPGVLYVYDRDNKTVVEERPDAPPPPPVA
jgi:CDGSH-type Zn-finger protein